MKPLLCPSRIRLPRPRTPLPAYMTLPSLAATTGEPMAPSMLMTLLVLLKAWMFLPLAGQPQYTRLASLAGADDVSGAAAGSVDAGVVLAGPHWTGVATAV